MLWAWLSFLIFLAISCGALFEYVSQERINSQTKTMLFYYFLVDNTLYGKQFYHKAMECSQISFLANISCVF